MLKEADVVTPFTANSAPGLDFRVATGQAEERTLAGAKPNSISDGRMTNGKEDA